MEKKIIDLLEKKSIIKQDVYRKTQSFFLTLQSILKEKSGRISDLKNLKSKGVLVEYSSKGKFEAQIKFSGDTLLFHMHSNVFDFPANHPIHKKKYIKEDNSRSFCGIINVYNFLSDSLKYNRMNDVGFLIGRIFINKDMNFFVEGVDQLAFLYDDISTQKIDKKQIDEIINLLMIYALEFDLQTPNFNDVREASVYQVLDMSNNQKLKTTKRMGYKLSHETNNK